MLYPMKWENEWPVVGPEGRAGKGVVTYRKPAVKGRHKMSYPHHSDSFDKPELAGIWEFNHVPHKEMWSLTDRRDSSGLCPTCQRVLLGKELVDSKGDRAL